MPVVFDPASLAAGEAAPVIMAASRSARVPVPEAMHEIARIAAALNDAGCGRLAYKACASFDSTKRETSARLRIIWQRSRRGVRV